ncbi:MAG: hypothetical protein IJG13_16805 [Kiritimatiellae bacterium]|nr:hypothetical protein [Kiritimatiellia bacterium]
MKKLLCSLLSVSSLLAFADGWSWSGKTGAVVIPAGTTADVADADVVTVAALASITVESTAVLNFVNTGTPIVLNSTTLAGAGRIAGTGSKGLSLGADNSGFTGTMAFENCYVYVTSSNGLGRASGVWHTVTAASGGLTGTLRFRGDGLTCDVPLTLAGWRNNTGAYLTDSLTDNMVFNKDVTVNGAGMNLGNYTFNAKYISNASTSGSVTFGGDTVFNGPINLRGAPSRRTFWLGAGHTATLCVPGSTWGDDTSFSSSGTLVCGAAGVLDPDRAMMVCYENAASTDHNTVLDLNGFDQSTTRIWHYFTVNASSKPYFTVRSATPATLTMTYAGDSAAAVKFLGRASYTHAGAGTYTIWNQYSDTLGTLYVPQGCVKLSGGAGWGGAVDVGSAGTLVFESGAGLNISDRSVVNVSAGGKLDIAAGVALTCGKLTVDDVELAAGVTYTKANHADFISGDGSITVVANPFAGYCVWTGEGDGWGDAASWEGGVIPSTGDKVAIPSGLTATVADADVDVVSDVSEIWLSGTLSLTNVTQTLELNADLKGRGSCVADGAIGGLVLRGENEAFTGAMNFHNTPVTVESRHGLGSPTRTVTHSYAVASGARLWFKGNGLTNDVPINLIGARKDSASCYPILAELGDPYVQNGALTYSGDSMVFGDWTFNGDVVRSGYSAITIYVHGETFFNGGFSCDRCNGYVFAISQGSKCHIAQYAGQWPGQSIGGKGTYVCEGSNVLSWDRSVFLGAQTGEGIGFGTIDLNGQDQQTVELSLAPVSNPSRSSPRSCFVTSAVPAAIELTTSGATGWSCVHFTGKAGLRMSGTGKYALKWVDSDTSGLLEVPDHGEIDLLEGAVWRGNVSVGGTGRVVVDSDAGLHPDGTSEVSLSDSAKLSIGSGNTLLCSKLTVGGAELPVGTYSMGNLPDWIEGDGSIMVKPTFVKGETFVWTGAAGNGSIMDGGNWEGGEPPSWNGTSVLRFADDMRGNQARLAGDVTVYGIEFVSGSNFTLSASGNAEILLGPGGIKANPASVSGSVTYTVEADLQVYCPQAADWTVADSATLALSGALSGGAANNAVTVVGGALELAGDNSGLGAQLVLRDNAVRVLHPHGLGSSVRAATYSNADGADFKFVGAGLTNSTPLVILTSFPDESHMITENFGDPLVMKGELKFGLPAGSEMTFFVGAEYRFEGGIASAGCTRTFRGRSRGESSMRIADRPILNGEGTMVGTVLFGSDVTLFMDAVGSGYGQMYLGGHTVCGATNALTAVAGAGQLSLGTSLGSYGGGFLDLNGYDQDFGIVFNNGNTPPKGSAVIGTVTSEVPAFMRNLRSDGTPGAEQTEMAWKFSGKAGFWQAGKRGNVLVNALSDSSGELRVTDGALTLRWGAGWTNVTAVTISGGVLHVEEDCAARAFGPRGGSSQAVLNMSGDGKLDIQGGRATVNAFYVNGQKVGPGVYGKGDMPQLVGDGKLKVRGGGLRIIVR